ncbi:tetratricopeptide repeat protein [Vibrio marisflavi]|uniref:Putative beta-barrel assembly-enhancing protease n=1 Tax=Vibrio marisflavi CECT 7928 TaxID=634439 RepID=A0ABN8E3T8_9VIBR|nr:M48 family metallopeptidase [Vibrio marisflavi]CAH0539093.1 Beta-barrel assembly-enhancing protease [Vibrio marisflavi CECT 7928]
MFKRWRYLVYLSVVTAVGIPRISIAQDQQLPDIGTAAAGTLTIDQEKIYGDAYMRLLRATKPIVNDPVLNEFINNLGHRLVASANDVKTPFTFFLIQNKSINAFAFFGGHVALHTGLFLQATTESELASVMAHEIAHVTQRHLARSMEEQAKRTPATVAALAGSILLAIAAPQAGIAAITATTAGNIQSQINYTRSNEIEADRFGLATLERAGFNVLAMPTFFGRLADEYRYASTPPPMLLTHPLPDERLTDTRERALQYPKNKVKPSLSYYLARMRVIVRYVNMDAETAKGWIDRNEPKAPRVLVPAFQYGRALVYLDNKKPQEAEKILHRLYEQSPTNDFYLDALSDAYIALKTPEKAQVMLEKALQIKSNNKVLTVNLANVYIKENKFETAIRLLQRYTHDNPEDTVGWQLLIEASAKSGKRAEELAAQGELLALRANWDKAIQRYTDASKLAKLGSLAQARYDARIDQLIVQRNKFNALK